MAESQDSSGNWLMTYGDFMTLLMIFFIMLYTLTPGVDKQRFQAVLGAFKSGKGVLKHQSVVSTDVPNLRAKRSRSWQRLKMMIKDKNLKKQIKIKIVPSGVRIVLGEAVTFKTYSAKLIPKSYGILQTIGQTIEDYNAEPLETVEVFGHTDNRPVVENAPKYPSNWSLGAARAISVVKYLMKQTSIDDKKFEAATFGKNHPRASNQTKKGRQKNRRVEIFVRYMQSKKPTMNFSPSSLAQNDDN